jgi:hypothetical protein
MTEPSADHLRLTHRRDPELVPGAEGVSGGQPEHHAGGAI